MYSFVKIKLKYIHEWRKEDTKKETMKKERQKSEDKKECNRSNNEWKSGGNEEIYIGIHEDISEQEQRKWIEENIWKK